MEARHARVAQKPASLRIAEMRTGFAAAIIASLSLGLTSTWFFLDRTPPSWDDGYYLTKSLELYDTLTDKGVAAYATALLRVMDSKPPLIAALPTPIYLVAGRHYRAAYAINVLFLAMIFGAAYGIAATYAGPRAGLIAVTALAAIPVIYGLSHWYLVECGLTALVCVAIYLMTGWSESSGPGRAGLLGITCGLGLLMKASFPVYVLVPFAYFAFRWRKTALPKRTLAAFFAASALVAAPWYVVNVRRVIRSVLNTGSADTARIYQMGEAFSASAIGHYLSNLANATPWLYLAGIPLLALVGASSLHGENKKGLFLGLLWISPLAFLAVGHYRDIRWAAPLYPAVALMFAWIADAAIRRRRAAAIVLVCAALSLGWLSMLQNSFGVFGKRLELGGLLLNAPMLSYARAYGRVSWPQRGILADIYRASRFGGGERRQILLGTNSVRFNADNFTLAAVEAKLPFEIGTTAYFTDASKATQAVHQTSYFVYKEGGESDLVNFNTLGETAIREARDSGRFMELPLSRRLPDGGIAHVLLNPSATGVLLSADLNEIPACKVTFTDGIQLTGIGVTRTRKGLEVKYRWRCLRPIDRDYMCFSHVVDRTGKVVGYLDHRFLNGDTPTSLWKMGDTALESFFFPLPEEDSGAYSLRVGVYYRESGERLQITESSFPIIDDQTAAVVQADINGASSVAASSAGRRAGPAGPSH
jgi:4-amino-4-deoxy-L-arabinose transferase-like glycosyltransferase